MKAQRQEDRVLFRQLLRAKLDDGAIDPSIPRLREGFERLGSESLCPAVRRAIQSVLTGGIVEISRAD